MSTLVISEPSNFKRRDIPKEVKTISDGLVLSQLDAIQKKIKGLGSSSSEEAKRLYGQAAQLVDFFVLNMTDSDKDILQDVRAAFGRVSTEYASKSKRYAGPSIAPQLRQNFVGELQLAQGKRLQSLQLNQPKDKKEEKTEAKEVSVIAAPQQVCSLLQENILSLIAILRQPLNLSAEGLFRISGQKKFLDSVDTQKIDPSSFTKIQDVHTVAGILKKILREMPMPLLEPVKEQLLKIQNPKADIAQVKEVINMLNSDQKEILNILIGFLAEVAAKSGSNKMTAANLSTCIMPNLVKQPESMEEQFAQMQNTAKLNTVFAVLIESKDQIF